MLLLTLSFGGITSNAQYSVNGADCDNIIRTTYENTARDYNKRATTENAQRCLADAGFWNYKDANGKLVFTGIYLDVTESAARDYLNRGTAPAATNKAPEEQDATKKAADAKAESLKLAEQAKVDAQKNAEAQKLQTQSQSTSQSTQSIVQPTTTNIDQTSASKNNQVAIGTNGNTLTDSREPATGDKFLVQVIYFLFALPFILFAISIIAAFLKVFKKPNQ